MLQRIRLSMKNQSLVKFGNQGGPVEMDETLICGKISNLHKKETPPLAGAVARLLA
jgi:hypothetical protein